MVVSYSRWFLLKICFVNFILWNIATAMSITYVKADLRSIGKIKRQLENEVEDGSSLSKICS